MRCRLQAGWQDQVRGRHRRDCIGQLKEGYIQPSYISCSNSEVVGGFIRLQLLKAHEAVGHAIYNLS